MKHKVTLSRYSVFLSASVLIAFLVWLNHSDESWLIMIIGLLILVGLVLAFYYMPLYVSVNEKELCVNRSLCSTKIPFLEIEDIHLTQPTMGERNLGGSYGWFGHWGWFSERDLGKYFAYYGKSSDCFLVKLKDGRQYMLGCDNPDDIVAYIRHRLGYSSL